MKAGRIFVAIPAMDPAWGTVYTCFFGACGVAVGIASLYKYYQLTAAGRGLGAQNPLRQYFANSGK